MDRGASARYRYTRQVNLENSMQKVTLPVMYVVRDKSIPARLTLTEREIFVHGAGVPRPAAAVLAMQDRAASLAAVLATLIERSGQADLVAQASKVIEKWNAECDEFFAKSKIHG